MLKTESCLSAEQLHEYSRHSTDSSARMQPASGNALSQHEGSEKYKGAQEYELYRDSSGNGIPTIILGAIIDDTRKEDSNCGELIEKTENILDDDAEAAICKKIISAHECSQSALRSTIRMVMGSRDKLVYLYMYPTVYRVTSCTRKQSFGACFLCNLKVPLFFY